MHKPEWMGYFATVGVAPDTVSRFALLDVGGWFEIGLGVAILARPWPGLLLFAFVWKLGTEWLRPLAGEPMWEFIERGGSYAAPLALLWLQAWPTRWPQRRAPLASRALREIATVPPGEEARYRWTGSQLTPSPRFWSSSPWRRALAQH